MTFAHFFLYYDGMNKFREKEKQLEKKYNYKDNEIILDMDESKVFSGEKISEDAMFILERNAMFMDSEDEIIIKTKCEDGERFTNALEKTVSRKVYVTRKQENLTIKMSLLLFLIGTTILSLNFFFLYDKVGLLYEFFLIASWVFVWSGVEQFFFKRRELKYKRVKLLQLLFSKIEKISESTSEK